MDWRGMQNTLEPSPNKKAYLAYLLNNISDLRQFFDIENSGYHGLTYVCECSTVESSDPKSCACLWKMLSSSFFGKNIGFPNSDRCFLADGLAFYVGQ